MAIRSTESPMMKPFLQLVADDLRKRTDGDFSRTLVVFPGKRAGLFLDEYLAEGEAPLWSPRYFTITDFFRCFCPLTPADPIETACRIYRLYADTLKKGSSSDIPDLDRFYGWAERLLSDFDDIDKALVNARALFLNLRDLQELDSKDFLTPEQKEVLRQFFKDFSPTRRDDLRHRFLRLWQGMPEIYARLQQELEAEGLAYEGMLQRRAAENLEAARAALPADVERVAIVGFNVLSPVERKLFRLLQKETEALFYWDYDTFTLREGTEAGRFMRTNLRDFPNALPPEAFSNLLQPKDIRFVSTTSDNAQARYVAPWLRRNLTADARRTAIVLCDENLLQPVLHALPPEVREINITKGYPLAATEAYAHVMRRAESLENRALPPAEFMSGLLEAPHDGRDADGDACGGTDGCAPSVAAVLEQEARFHAHLVLTRIARLVESGWLTLSTPTLRKLIKQVMRRQSVPFHGEPVRGLQVMGMLETRCLDFESLLILSADDRHLPRSQTDNSFIPRFVREAYGLPTPRHNAALYAHHLHRLLSRTSRVSLLWSTAGDAAGGGEMSRFMTQLLLEAPQLPIRATALQAAARSTAFLPLAIAKPADIACRLAKLSPSALNDYLLCPARFYFRRVSRLEAWQEPSEGIAQNDFGTIFHDAARMLYTDLSRNLTQPVTSDLLARALEAGAEPQLLRYIARAFDNTRASEKTLTGALADYPVERAVLLQMLKDLLRAEQGLGSISLIALEQEYFATVPLPVAGGSGTVRVGGVIDRLDLVTAPDGTQTLRVLDYKTGKPRDEKGFRSVDDLFRRGADHPKYIFQTFVYALAIADAHAQPLRPALHYTGAARRAGYDAYVPLPAGTCDIRPLLPEFRERLAALIAEICDPAQPFTARPEPAACRHCDFRHLCLH